MSESQTPAELYAQLVKAVFDEAPNYGYKKSGKLIKKIAFGNAAMVEFQRSRDNTKDHTAFTLNLAIVNGEMLKIDGLMYPFGTTLQSSKDHTSHFNIRVGRVLKINDCWWSITYDTDINNLILEIKDTIYNKAVPYLEKYLKSEDLLELWVSNGYHGLTLYERDKYAKALSEILKNGLKPN